MGDFLRETAPPNMLRRQTPCAATHPFKHPLRQKRVRNGTRFGIVQDACDESVRNPGLWSSLFSIYQRKVKSIPASSETSGFQPKAVRRLESMSFFGVPSGLVVSNVKAPSNPTTRATVSASSR